MTGSPWARRQTERLKGLHRLGEPQLQRDGVSETGHAAGSIFSTAYSSTLGSGGADGHSIAEVLARHGELSAYATAFQDAKIDLALAAEMVPGDYQRLLPSDAPLGHALKLRKLLAAAAASTKG